MSSNHVNLSSIKPHIKKPTDCFISKIMKVGVINFSLPLHPLPRQLKRIREMKSAAFSAPEREKFELDVDSLKAQLLAQRADVAEELDRLVIHVEEARTILRAPGPHGRRLDFLTQELNREANTLGAKATLIESSQKSVDLKVIIEQIREQVQNIE